jgi:hypothetical protein
MVCRRTDVQLLDKVGDMLASLLRIVDFDSSPWKNLSFVMIVLARTLAGEGWTTRLDMVFQS